MPEGLQTLLHRHVVHPFPGRSLPSSPWGAAESVREGPALPRLTLEEKQAMDKPTRKQGRCARVREGRGLEGPRGRRAPKPPPDLTVPSTVEAEERLRPRLSPGLPGLSFPGFFLQAGVLPFHIEFP